MVAGLIGLMLGSFQWFYPKAPSKPELSAPSLSAQPVLQMSAKPTMSPQLPSPDKTAYHGIVGFLPPTDLKTIQRREKLVKEVYAMLTQPDMTAIVLTGIGGIGKSVLAALVYRYTEELRRGGSGLFAAETLWLTVAPNTTMDDLAGMLFGAMGKPLPDFHRLTPQNQAFELFNALNTVDKAQLVILNQFENLLDSQTGQATDPGLGEWIDMLNSQPCRCRILLTSRPVPRGTHEYPPTHLQEYPSRAWRRTKA